MSRSAASSTASDDGAPTADHDRGAGDGRLLDELERQPAADAEDVVAAAGGSPSSSARPTTLSIALWRPTSSRTMQELAVGVEQAGRVQAAGAREGRAGADGRAGPRAATGRPSGRPPPAARARRPPPARPCRTPRTTRSCRSAARRDRAAAARRPRSTFAARSSVRPAPRAAPPDQPLAVAGSRARAPRRGRACAS